MKEISKQTLIRMITAYLDTMSAEELKQFYSLIRAAVRRKNRK